MLMFHLSFLWSHEIICEHRHDDERQAWWISISGIKGEAEERFPHKLALIISTNILVSTISDCQNCQAVCCHSHSLCSFLVPWIKLRMNPPGAPVPLAGMTEPRSDKCQASEDECMTLLFWKLLENVPFEFIK